MPEEQAWLEPIRTAAAAIVADPPSLTEWEAGEEGESEVIDGDVEKLLQELGWPTRTRTFTFDVTPFFSDSDETVPHESTSRYFPATWLVTLTARVAEYVQTRDAGQAPQVPDRLRLRHLPVGTDFCALRGLVEAAWDEAGDELACSIAVMYPDEAMGMDGWRLNLATYLWYGPAAFDARHQLADETVDDPAQALSFAERMKRAEEDGFSDLRNLPSPKWRAWFSDTLNDRIAIHDTLALCGVNTTSHLGTDLHRARYAIDADTTRMTVEELVCRVQARHRLFVAAVRAVRNNVNGAEPGSDPDRARFGPRRTMSRPPEEDAMMKTVARFKGENVRWKEIKEQVETMYQYRFDSEEALRKKFERWMKGRQKSG